MKRSKRVWWIVAIALGAIVLITLLAAPSNDKLGVGSTYSRAPEGYGAWYAFMQKQGTPVKRWQKPFNDLVKVEQPITLLRVSSQMIPTLGRQEQEWLKKGNTLVVLGVWQPVTSAAFSTWQESNVGIVKIDTRRRHKSKELQQLLGDRFGAVVWREQVGKGQVIYATTSYLAANAYQDYPGNYKYLAQLVNKSGRSVWVDEYIHGYKDADAIASAAETDLLSYLAQKPIFPALLQIGILLLVLIWAQNRRFGQPQALDTPIVDNSTAYIQALAGVLQKAESSDFVLDMVGSSEQMQLQQALGLGQIPLESQTLVQAWVQQTGRSPAELEQLLRQQSQKRRISDKDLSIWLEKWKSIRSYAKPD
jgi:hypothetical protein